MQGVPGPYSSRLSKSWKSRTTETKGDRGEITTKYYEASWILSSKRKRPLWENWWNQNEVFSYRQCANVRVLVYKNSQRLFMSWIQLKHHVYFVLSNCISLHFIVVDVTIKFLYVSMPILPSLKGHLLIFSNGFILTFLTS